MTGVDLKKNALGPVGPQGLNSMGPSEICGAVQQEQIKRALKITGPLGPQTLKPLGPSQNSGAPGPSLNPPLCHDINTKMDK